MLAFDFGWSTASAFLEKMPKSATGSLEGARLQAALYIVFKEVRHS
jgi:hypothetical protein